MIRVIIFILSLHFAFQTAIFEYQSILVKGFSHFEKRDYVLVNTTDLSERVVSMVHEKHRYNIQSDYQQNYLKMQIKDFLFRVFSQRFYLYELVFDFQSDISLMTGKDILTQLEISKDGLDKLNAMSTPYKLKLEMDKVDKTIKGGNQMGCKRITVTEDNTESNIIIEMCNFTTQINQSSELTQDENIHDINKEMKNQLKPDDY